MIRRLITAGSLAFLAVAAVPVTASAAPDRTLVVSAPGTSCPGATFDDVAAAIEAARPGDTVRLCPGTYPSAIVVDKAVTLLGPLPTPTESSCLAADASDPAHQAVLTGGLTLTAAGSGARGLVTDGAATGITTSPQHGGYRITGNLVRGTSYLGIELESNGATTEVDHNCVRDHTGGGITAENGQLRNAVIHDNVTYANNEGISTLGEFRHDAITITEHRSVADLYGIILAGTRRSSITDSEIDGRGSGGVRIQVGGGNDGLRISGNDLTGSFGLPGIFFNRHGADFADPRPNRHLVITGNTVHDNVGSGLSMASLSSDEAGYLQDSLVARNVFRGNAGSGMFIGSGSSDNVIYDNVSSANGRGLRLSAGASGNLVIANTMLNNVIIDALDENAPSTNVWVDNVCRTSAPEGLCTGN